MGCSQVVRQRTLTPLFVGSSPTTPAKGLVAQWTRARGYEPRCQGFESLLAQYSYYIDSKIDIYIQFPYNLLKMGRRQAVRQRTLTPPFVGSNPPASDTFLTDFRNHMTKSIAKLS